MQPREPILVVSPDATSLEGLRRALAWSGLPVVPASGWAEAESRLRHVRAPAIVIDVGEMSPEGLDRLRRWRAEFPDVAIIVLVSLSTPEVRTAEAEGLVLAAFEKPITLTRLEASLRLALARSTSP